MDYCLWFSDTVILNHLEFTLLIADVQINEQQTTINSLYWYYLKYLRLLRQAEVISNFLLHWFTPLNCRDPFIRWIYRKASRPLHDIVYKHTSSSLSSFTIYLFNGVITLFSLINLLCDLSLFLNQYYLMKWDAKFSLIIV